MNFNLSKLGPKAGSRKRKKRVGCGEGSGHGKTSCRGGKGQTARTGGGVRAGFEGGQMPLYRRLPKYGFVSSQQVAGINRFNVVNLSFLDGFDSGATIDEAALRNQGFSMCSSNRAGIKILSSGKLTKKLHVKAHAFSAKAKQAIESLGGTAELVASK